MKKRNVSVKVSRSAYSMQVNTSQLEQNISNCDQNSRVLRNVIDFFDSSQCALAYCQVDIDTSNNVKDFCFLDINPIFAHLFGEVKAGMHASQCLPELLDTSSNVVLQIASVILTGNSSYFEWIWGSDKQLYDCAVMKHQDDSFIMSFRAKVKTTTSVYQFLDSPLYSIMIENAADGIAIIDQWGNFKYLSPAGRRILGYGQDEIIMEKPRVQVHPEDLFYLQKQLDSLFANPDSSSKNQYRYLSKSKEWLSFECTLKSMLHDPLINGIIINFKDITEEKKILEELSESEARFKSYFSFAPLGVLISNNAGQFVQVNATACEVLGYDEQSLISMTYFDILPEYMHHRLRNLLEIVDVNGSLVADVELIKRDKLSGVFTQHVVKIKENEYANFFSDITHLKKIELELREKNVQFNNLANSGVALVWASDVNKNCYYFNNSWLQFTGRTLEQEFNHGWTDSVHPDDLDECLSQFYDAFDNLRPFTLEYRLRHFSGEYRWIMDQGNPNYNCNGDFIGYMGSCLDITDRVNMESKLRLSEVQFRTIFEDSVVPKFFKNLDGNITMNKSLRTLLGYTEEANNRLYESDITYPDDVSDDQLIYNSILDGEITQASWEKRFITKAGKVIWVNEMSILLRDENENPLHYVSEIYNITPRKRTESALVNSEYLFEKAFATSPDGISITRMEDGMYLEISSGISKVFGYSVDEVVGKTSLEIDLWYEPNDRKIWLQKLVNEGAVDNFETRFRCKDKRIIYALISASLIDLKGEKHILSIVRDITDRKQAEEKLAESELFFRQTQAAGQIGSYCFDVLTGNWTSSKVFDHILGIDESYVRDYNGWLNTFIPEAKENMLSIYEQFRNGTITSYDFEVQVMRPSDSVVVWLQASGELICEEGKPAVIAGVAQDISERKAKEMELRENLINLQRFQKLTIDREMVMIDLKKEINQLLQDTGLPPKYKIVG